MSVNPIAGNDRFTNVNNTELDSQALQSALKAGNSQVLLVASGSVNVTLQGNYAVENNNSTVVLPQNAVVVRVSLVGDGTLASALATTFVVGTATDDGLVVTNAFHTAVSPGAVLVGTLAPVVNQAVGSEYNYLSLTVAGGVGADPSTPGRMNVSVLYYLP